MIKINREFKQVDGSSDLPSNNRSNMQWFLTFNIPGVTEDSWVMSDIGYSTRVESSRIGERGRRIEGRSLNKEGRGDTDMLSGLLKKEPGLR